MKEGSLEAPTRRPIAWDDPDFADRTKTEAEIRWIWDICHTCRRCFNLCDALPRLFDLIDSSATGELDSVAVQDYHKVADACTLCDMCFMTKCPYVPPHEFNVDFPHVMLRYRAVELLEGKKAGPQRELAKTGRNGRVAGLVAPLVNWANNRRNRLTRPAMEMMLGIDREAAPPVDYSASAVGRKAILYATCFANYNNPHIGQATRAVLSRNGAETEVLYPRCCGMPQLKQGDLAAVARSASEVAAVLGPRIDEGYDVVVLVPSCALLLKFEWPLIVPGNSAVEKLSKAPFDISEYIVDIARTQGLAPGLSPLEGGLQFTSPAMPERKISGKKRSKCCGCRLAPTSP